MQLKYLSKLHLGNKFGRQATQRQHNDTVLGFTFYEGVAPVLSAIGSNLRHLVLEDFHQVDILLIGHLCPNLEHLALSGISSFVPVLSMSQNFKSMNSNEMITPFHKLKVLELWQDVTNSITDQMLKTLLCNGSPIARLVFQRYIIRDRYSV